MKTIVYMAISADGFIAGTKGETPWLPAEWKSFAKMVKSCGNIVIGRKTYEVMHKQSELKKLGDPIVVVISRKTLPGVVCVKTPQMAVKLLRAQGFSTALVCGGSKLNTSFFDDGLVDELYLDVEPFLFGKGIPLFKGKGKNLKLIEVTKLSGNEVQLHYEVWHG